MPELPTYLEDQTFEAILKRMLDQLPSTLDKSEGSFIWDSLSPVAVELALAAIWAQEVLRRSFAETTFGQYLDLRAEEHGLTRRAATKATGEVTFTGTPGVTIPAGTRVSTTADAATGASAIEFQTTQEAVVGGGGSVTVPIEAVEAGADGNVVAGSVNIIMVPVAGVSSVTNAASTSGGYDTEDDASLLARYLFKVRNPSAGGNKADYINWALEVPGVGAVRVLPTRDGPGTVAVIIVDAERAPAPQGLVDAVQEYIAPPWRAIRETENMTLGGYGVSLDDLGDDSGLSAKMVYNATGPGTITDTVSNILVGLLAPWQASGQTTWERLPQAGTWQLRLRVKVDSTAGANDLLQVGMYNVSGGVWCKTRPGGSVDALVTKRASDLATSFADVTVEFYWNGVDTIELRITRLQTDVTTAVWVDYARYISTFSRDTGDGKAPAGARVAVEAPVAVPINVSATLTVAMGYGVEAVQAAATANITEYIQSLAFTDDNDVRYVRIGGAILDTPGVIDYSNLLVNGGTANVAVGEQEIAVVGTVTLT
ncbi:MAG: baseplate J/gp47 family protein [Bacteroidota bacterium]